MDRTDTMSLFVAAIDTGSLSGAARISGISLSSVSRHLSALEERVGTKLLIRTTRTLALTEAGQRYYDKSKRILTEIDEMESGLHTDADCKRDSHDSTGRQACAACRVVRDRRAPRK